MDKLIGKTLNERYILTEIVGVGGMAVVYKAFDQVVNRIVAVKILKEEFMSDAQFRRRFTNESKAITMLSQNNIVDVYDVCLEGDLMYLVMEYIDGITLKEYLDKVKVLEWHEASFYIKQILKAMSHAHERGIVHRDLKPHNIMLLRDGTIKVTDFGIAKLTKFDTHTITDKAIGSVHYISPEQASGDRTDEKTDIYSVGVMFYEMLTGTLPFVGDSAVSVALMQVQAQPKLPREINSNIPEGIEEITIKAMMKDPSVRYASALAMFNDIVSVEETPDMVFGYIYSDAAGSGYTQVDEPDNSPTQFVDIASADQPLQDPELLQPTEDESEEDVENKFKTTWLPIILGVLTAIVVVIGVIALIVFWHEITQFFSPSKAETTQQEKAELVEVGNYVGMDYSEIEANNPHGFIFKRENAISDKKAGTIVSQDPVEGTKIEKGSEIILKVSIGKETDAIPDLTMMHYSTAFNKMNEVGIKFTTVYIASETVPENYVIKTSPQGGDEATSDTIVKIYISTGSPVVTKTVPDLLNNSKDDAVKKLENEGLKADIKYVYNDDVAKDCVISQNPAKGTKVDQGTTVVIEVSNGPKVDNTDKPDDGTDSTDKPDDTNTPGNTDNPNDPGNTDNPGNNDNPGNTDNPGSGDSSGTDDNPGNTDPSDPGTNPGDVTNPGDGSDTGDGSGTGDSTNQGGSTDSGDNNSGDNNGGGNGNSGNNNNSGNDNNSGGTGTGNNTDGKNN